MDFSGKSKLLVVDDSALMKIQKLQPNVVTMDIEMPELNGLDALNEIMLVCPVPVVMLSSTTQYGAENALTAIEYGAVDFVTKPSGTISLDLHKIQDELVRKVEQAALVPIPN